jgi:cysteine dioxygenase
MSEPDCISISELVNGVQRRLEAGQPDQVTDYLNATRIQSESLVPYTHFRDAHYSRNLIFKNELFEMLLLCWGVGHRSWIHNHRGQHCWMAVVQGTLSVRNYKRLGCDQQLRTTQLEPLSEAFISPGGLAKVDPDEPVHVVWNPAELNQPAMSIHIYSQPFDTCVVYDDEQGFCRDITLFYTSEYGVVTEQHKGGRTLSDLPACECTLTSAEQAAHCGIISPIATSAIHLSGGDVS